MYSSHLISLLLLSSSLFFLPTLAIPHLARRHPHLSGSRRSISSLPKSASSHSRIQRTFPPFLHSSNKLSLKKLKTRDASNQGVHSTVLLQQHLNKSLKRYAKMTKREVPSDGHLEGKLRRRMEIVEEQERVMKMGKRDSTIGRAGKAMAGIEAGLEAVGAAFFGGGNKKSNGNGNGNGNAGSTTTTSSSTGTTSSTSTGTGSTSNSTSAGFSQTALNDANGGTVTPASNPTGANSLGLNIEANNVGYFATIQLGTPPTDYKILMDSGSADFWVPSEDCSSCGTTHTTLGTTSSSTFVASTSPFAVTYGTGSVSGNIISDDVSIAGLALSNHSFGATTVESVQFGSDTVPFDGLMGLAQSTLSEQKVPTPIESLAAAGTVPAAQMGFHLATVDGSNDGEVTFGGVDTSKFTGSITQFANVNTEGFWEGAVDDVTVNGQSLNLAGRTAILDTGTTLMVLPPNDAAALHAAIPGAASDGQGGFTVPCTTTASLAMTFGGTAFAVNPASLAFLPVNDNNLTGDCVSAISSGEIGAATEWLLGDAFLTNTYFSTDVGSNSIGLAPSLSAP